MPGGAGSTEKTMTEACFFSKALYNDVSVKSIGYIFIP